MPRSHRIRAQVRSQRAAITPRGCGGSLTPKSGQQGEGRAGVLDCLHSCNQAGIIHHVA